MAAFTIGLAPVTVNGYTRAVRIFAQLLLDTGTDWTEATPHLIETHVETLRRAGASEAALNIHISGIRALYNWAMRRGIMTSSPAVSVRTPRSPTRSVQRWYSREEAREILAVSLQAQPPVGLVVHLALLNGLRRGDILNARGEHVRIIEHRVALWLPKRKMGRMDTVTLPESTVDLLPVPLRGALVPHSASWLDSRLDVMADQLGLDHRLRLHQLRATFVTLSLDAGVPPRDVMASAGHAHLDTTAYYDRAYGSIRRNASGRLADYLAEPED